jgi:hypothetical protein
VKRSPAHSSAPDRSLGSFSLDPLRLPQLCPPVVAAACGPAELRFGIPHQFLALRPTPCQSVPKFAREHRETIKLAFDNFSRKVIGYRRGAGSG